MSVTMFRNLILLLCLICSVGFISPVLAADEENAEATESKYAYYELSSDIVTNFVSPPDRLGYLRVAISLMVADVADLSVAELHEPLIRDAVIEVIGRQPEAKITSLAGREEIRQECLKQIHRLMIGETNRKVIINLLFTKYLYD